MRLTIFRLLRWVHRVTGNKIALVRTVKEMIANM